MVPSRRTTRTLGDYLSKQMKNPRFRKAWEEVQKEDELPKKLITLRVEQGLTQGQVAKMVGSKQASISRLEHNPPSRPTPLLRKVAGLYGYNVEGRIQLVAKSSQTR